MDAQGSGKRHGRRIGIGACIAVAMLTSLALIVASGFGSEQAATQNITVTLSKGTTTVTGTDALVSGLTRITARNTTRLRWTSRWRASSRARPSPTSRPN